MTAIVTNGNTQGSWRIVARNKRRSKRQKWTAKKDCSRETVFQGVLTCIHSLKTSWRTCISDHFPRDWKSLFQDILSWKGVLKVVKSQWKSTLPGTLEQHLVLIYLASFYIRCQRLARVSNNNTVRPLVRVLVLFHSLNLIACTDISLPKSPNRMYCLKVNDVKSLANCSSLQVIFCL